LEKKVTNALNKEKTSCLSIWQAMNISAVDTKEFLAVVTPDFKDYKDGKLKIISFYAKKARGMMVRYIIDTDAKTINDLQGFNYGGYQFDATLSAGNHLVFTR
jgi:cytoplasmic iron level regulating protein YaaA (DUF328/UPF0246 family)